MIARATPESIGNITEHQTARTYVLDIGIGIGGSYLAQDKAQGVFRLGIDINPLALEICERNYSSPNLALQTLDIFVQKGERLPFEGQQFDRIEIYFPHYSGLYALISGRSGLWQEMDRILRPGGSVHVISDFDADNTRIIRSSTRRVHFDNPHLNMAKAAREAQFNVVLTPLTPDEAKARVMTHFSKKIAKSGERGGSHIYHLLAKKTRT